MNKTYHKIEAKTGKEYIKDFLKSKPRYDRMVKKLNRNFKIEKQSTNYYIEYCGIFINFEWLSRNFTLKTRKNQIIELLELYFEEYWTRKYKVFYHETVWYENFPTFKLLTSFGYLMAGDWGHTRKPLKLLMKNKVTKDRFSLEFKDLSDFENWLIGMEKEI